MTQHTNKPRVSTNEMEARIREELEEKQQLELTRKLVEEHREELAELKSDVQQMRPWFRAGRWVVGAVVSAAIGGIARGGPATLKPKPVPCVQLQKVPAKTIHQHRPQR